MNSSRILTPAAKTTVADDTTKTILASYPGSGKKFTYSVIEGLTDHKAGDDWNFSNNGPDTLHLKTAYPHKEGVWTWGDKFSQAVLLIRNPRWSLPSYHNMRFELDFSSNWAESYVRIPFVYKSRPDVEKWESWRDVHFDEELENWSNYIKFWMEDGLLPDGSHDAHCGTDLDCHPKAILDFDKFYQEHPTTEFFKISKVLGTNANVELIAAEARACILDSVFDRKALHNANRNGNGPAPSLKKFSAAQLSDMLSTITELKNRYSVAPWTDDLVANELVLILDEYSNQITAEYEFVLDQIE